LLLALHDTTQASNTTVRLASEASRDQFNSNLGLLALFKIQQCIG